MPRSLTRSRVTGGLLWECSGPLPCGRRSARATRRPALHPAGREAGGLLRVVFVAVRGGDRAADAIVELLRVDDDLPLDDLADRRQRNHGIAGVFDVDDELLRAHLPHGAELLFGSFFERLEPDFDARQFFLCHGTHDAVAARRMHRSRSRDRPTDGRESPLHPRVAPLWCAAPRQAARPCSGDEADGSVQVEGGPCGRQARGPLAGHGRRGHDIHRRRRGRQGGTGQAHRIADPDGARPPRQAQREALGDDQGPGPARAPAGSGVRRLGPDSGRRVHGGGEGEGALARASRATAADAFEDPAHAGGVRQERGEAAGRRERQARHEARAREPAHPGHPRLHGQEQVHTRGNRVREVLDDPANFKTKEVSKLSVLGQIVEPERYPELYKDLQHKVSIHYYKPRGDNKAGWDNIDIVGWMGYPMQIKVNFLCRDSILAAPIVLDLALLGDLAARAGMKGIQEWLSFYFKSPQHDASDYPEHDLFVQQVRLEHNLRYLMGEELINYLGSDYTNE